MRKVKFVGQLNTDMSFNKKMITICWASRINEDWFVLQIKDSQYVEAIHILNSQLQKHTRVSLIEMSTLQWKSWALG